MSDRVLLLICVALFVSCIRALPVDYDSLPDDFTDCTPLKSLITRAVLTISTSYFADNPRGEEPPIEPPGDGFQTLGDLFREYYGANASVVEFKKAVLDLVYAKPPKTQKEDRIRLRRNLYKYASAGSPDFARKQMGTLILSLLNEYSGGSVAWTQYQCFPTSVLESVIEAISVEYGRLRNEIGDLKFGRFLGVEAGTSLTFVIDDTGSMSGEINAAKQRAQSILDLLQNSLDRPQDFVLVPFNDPGTGPVTVTNDPEVYRKALRKLYAHGGGDAPELSMRGIQLGIENSRPGSTIYVITDVDAKDIHLQDAVIALALEKEITVVFILTQRIISCNKLNGYLKCMDLYTHIATTTGGKVLIVGKSEVLQATEVVQSGLNQAGVTIAREVTRHSGGPRVLRFPVDKSVLEVSVEADGSCGQPRLTTSNGDDHQLQNRYGELKLVTLNVDGHLGNWSISFTPDGVCDVKVTAKSTLGVLLTVLAKNPEDSDSDYKIINGHPSPSQYLAFVIDTYGVRHSGQRSPKITTIRFVGEDGKEVLPSVPVKDVSNIAESSVTSYLNKGLGSVAPFYVVVDGLDENGNSFRRLIPRLVSPSRVLVECDLSDLVFRAGVRTQANITVANNGANDSFVFSVADTKGFSSNTRPKHRHIATGESRVFTVILQAPESTQDGLATILTATVHGYRRESFQYGVCTVVVGQKKRPHVNSLAIVGTINGRYAETVVTSIVTNNADIGREAEFHILLPSDAYIVNLTMATANETIVGSIETKEKAKKIYKEAKKTGKTAGHVAARDTSTRAFKTSLFVSPREVVTFQFTYQQLLRRIRGEYEYAVTISPDQPVHHLTVDVHIVEQNPIRFVRVPPLKTEQVNIISELDVAPGSTIRFGRDRRNAHVRYSPSITQQTEFSPLGLSGTFQVKYDVDRSQVFGDIAVNNGFFSHHFAPPSLAPFPKLVVFVIDTSGSMFGYKLKQMKQAIAGSLRSLNPEDHFNLVLFGDTAEPWISEVLSTASPRSVADAIAFVNAATARGGTNMLVALQTAFAILEPYLPPLPENATLPETTTVPATPIPIQPEVPTSHFIRKRATETETELSNYAKMIVFLTDGRPTEDKVGTDGIISRIEAINGERVNLHTMGFGSLVDMRFLDKLAALNGGVSRRVFESLDAATQIRNFFDEISSPVLTDVSVEYLSDKIEDVTTNDLDILFSGSEMVVAGRILEGEDLLDLGENGDSRPRRQISGKLRGRSFDNDFEIDFDLDPTETSRIAESPHSIADFTKRVWAFLKVKELLKGANIASNATLKEALREEALNMSLKHNFVTPLTSLVVVRPEDRKRIEAKLKKEAEAEKKRIEAEKRLEEEAKLVYTSRKKMRRPELALDFAPPARVSSESKGGFSGDPHFIVPLTPKINLCFNWDGEDGEVYNLLYDPTQNLTVNGDIVAVAAPPGSMKPNRTYISNLYIHIPQQKFKIIVRPYNVTFIPVGAQPFTVPVTTPIRFNGKGIRFQVHDITHTRARIDVIIDGLNFQVVLHRNNRHLYSTDHLDFSVRSSGPKLGRGVDGVIGQFLNSHVIVLNGDAEEKEAFILIDEQLGQVTRTKKKLPTDRGMIECWFARNNARELTRHAHERYLVGKLTAEPFYSVE